MTTSGAAAVGLVEAGTGRRLGVVRFEPPEMCRVSTVTTITALPLGMACAELRQRFAIEPVNSIPPVAAHVVLRFDSPEIVAWDVLATDPPMAVSELSDGVGWLLGDPLGNATVPLRGEVRVAVCAPWSTTEVLSFARMDVTVIRRGQRVHGGCSPVSFIAYPPDGWITDTRPVLAPREELVSGRRPAVRLCVAADAESYSRFSHHEAERAQRRLVHVLAHARRHAGVRESDVDLQSSGDGQFALLPAGLDETYVIPRLVEAIGSGLVAVNAELDDRERLRLRVALHRGHASAGANGWVGGVTVAVHRLLDSAAVRSALKQTKKADFALVVADVLYTDIIAAVGGENSCLDPAAFTRVDVVRPEKGFREQAWVCAWS